MEHKIYFNNCLTSKPAPEVVEAMLPYLKETFWFPENFIEEGSGIQDDIDRFRGIVARSLNAAPGEIHFTHGGTSANNLAIKGFITANTDRGTHIILSVGDYPDLLTNTAFFEQSGFDVTYLPIDWDGNVDPEALRAAIRPDTVLFMTTLVNHTMGTIQPVAEYRKVLDAAGRHIAMHVDACEAYARMPIDVKAMGIDLMSVSAHKIHGPQGVGALYVRKGTKLNQMSHGVARIDELETGGISVASLAGFAKAVELAFDDLDGKIRKIRGLSDDLLEKIEARIPHIILNGPRGEKRASHNMNISFEYIEGEAIMMMLSLSGVLVATGSACASKGLKPNYILMAAGRTHEQSHGSLKFTFSRYNTKQEIDYTVDKLAEIVEELRRRSPVYPGE
jgi:cysteine desulfurase